MTDSVLPRFVLLFITLILWFNFTLLPVFFSHCFCCSLLGLTPWKQSDYCLYHLLQETGLGQLVLCIGCWVKDREIWVIFLAWARDFSSPDTPYRLWRRPSPIQWVPWPFVRDKEPGHWKLSNTLPSISDVNIWSIICTPLAHLWHGAHINMGTKLPSVLRFGSHNFAYRIYLRFMWFSISTTITFLSRINSLCFVVETECLSLLLRK